MAFRSYHQWQYPVSVSYTPLDVYKRQSVFYGIEEHGCMIAGDVIFGLVLGEDIIGFGNRDTEQWMEKMLKDFPVLQKENSYE